MEKKGLKLIAKKCLTGEIFLLSKITRFPLCESWLYSLPDLENCECSSRIHFTSFALTHKSIKYILFRHMEICCPVLRNWIFSSLSIYFVSRLLMCGCRKWSQVHDVVKRVFCALKEYKVFTMMKIKRFFVIHQVVS